MNLLMIHGRAQEHKNPVLLQEEWEDTMRKGFRAAHLPELENVQIAFPFYGDELDRLNRELQAPLPDALARGEGGAVDAGELQFKADMYAELAKGYRIPDREIDAHYQGDVHEEGALNWNWVHAILKALDRTPLGDTAIDEFTHDVYVYLTCAAINRAVNQIVAGKLGEGKWVVVAHSLGTVVGYNVLRALKAQQNINVTRYVTVGSPLGVQAIRRRLGSLEMPACVKSWYNAFDSRDVVALYPLDAKNFPIEPAVTNNGTVHNHTDNCHGIAGYLDDANVAKQIAEAVGI